MKNGAGAVTGDAGEGRGDRGRQLCRASAVKEAAAGGVCTIEAVSAVAGVRVVSMTEGPGEKSSILEERRSSWKEFLWVGSQLRLSCSLLLLQHLEHALMLCIVSSERQSIRPDTCTAIAAVCGGGVGCSPDLSIVSTLISRLPPS